MIKLAENGIVRLKLAALLDLPLVHLLSGLDEDLHEQEQGLHGATRATISGYTEWVTRSVPVITLGWDWKLDTLRGSPDLVRVGEPRSNVMLVDVRGSDLGFDKTSVLIESAIDSLPWQQVVMKTIDARYSSP
ncbi:DUF4902 domain-containing protein [Luteimonas panaciterrae]|jgi:hypothetical protein|uniref:DUF4902 domain-containing protein n=1 Tax=Luteimonas panaciterrae TaxID=363885 RepID=UPI001CFC3E32|nr:DUF4902 domain-containing protein [Luteimonas panaciterrae]